MYVGNPFILFPSSGGYLLDTYTGATVAYSLRYLNSSYGGSCIRVRRSSDNAEQDIGFSSGVIDVSSMESFCSGTDGFVVTWYDQSGNATNATQSTAGSQPKIVTSGTTLTSGYNSKYAIDFDATDDYMVTSVALTQVFYQSWVFDRATSGIRSLPLGDITATPYSFYWTAGDDFYTAMKTQTLHDSNDTSTGDFLITSLRDTSNNLKYWLNGVAGTTQTYANSADTLIRLGYRNGQYHDGYFQELIYWSSDQESNRSAIETDVNGYYSIW